MSCTPPTTAQTLDAIATDVLDGVQSATDDAGTIVGMDALDRIKAADELAARKALAGTNPQGGARSLWGRLSMARVIPPGAV